MFKQYADLLIQETMIFNTLTALEKKKRRYILGAQGKELKKLTEKTEFYLNEITSIEKKRLDYLRKFRPENLEDKDLPDVNLTLITKMALRSSEVEQDQFEEIAHKYREAVHQLKKENSENEMLLKGSYRSISNVIDELKNINNQNDTYGPNLKSTRTPQQSGHSLLLNANA